MADMTPIPPPEQLPVPIRMTGIGNSHITIKASPEAQAWFDQGLSLLHDFWDYESAKAFEQSIRVDPNCAMCWWGLGQAEGFRGSDNQFYGNRAVADRIAAATDFRRPDLPERPARAASEAAKRTSRLKNFR